MEIVFYDLETTIPADHIIEFGGVVVEAETFVEVETFETLIYSNRITAWSIGSNGITQNMVAEAPGIADVAGKIFAMLDGRIWAGHNILTFDNPIIERTFNMLGLKPPKPADIIDTLPLSRKHLADKVENHKLATLAKHFSLGKEDHRSLSDARMCLDVLQCMNWPSFAKQPPEGMIPSNRTGDSR